MSFIQNLFTSRDNNANSATYVGQQDRLWWDPVTNRFYYSDGVTPGGFPVGSGGNATTNKLVNGAYELVLDASGNVTAPGAISAVGNVTANYFVGNGSQLTGINVSTNKIFNGNSYANIAVPNGNVEINANGQSWNFKTDGNLTLPGNTTTICSSANNFAVYTTPASTSGLEVSTSTETNLFNQNIVNIITNVGTSNKRWEFGADGNLTLPSGPKLISGYPGGGYTANVASLAGTDVYLANSDGSSWIGIDGGTPRLGWDSTSKYWNFGSDGNLTLPSGTPSINYANGTPYGGTGNVTAGNVTIQNQGNTLTTAVNTINFTGNGVSATNVGNVVTVNVTAGSGTLPSQTGNAGKILSTDGTNPLWETMPGVFGLVIDGGDAAFASMDFIIDGGPA